VIECVVADDYNAIIWPAVVGGVSPPTRISGISPVAALT
jgi:hypothetical protein